MKKLNLGCGNEKIEGFVNVDNNPNCYPDISHDLNVFPYPFSDDEFDEIYLDHVIEHLDQPLDVLQEIYRIAKNNALVIVKCPHFSCNWLHPGHKSAISINLFSYLDKNSKERYGKADFRVSKIKIYWIRNKKEYIENRSLLVKALNKIINFLANLNLGITERGWCYWVGGFEEIVFKARVIKSN